jgi:uncharacterized protein YyaL (SSP411 family)
MDKFFILLFAVLVGCGAASPTKVVVPLTLSATVPTPSVAKNSVGVEWRVPSRDAVREGVDSNRMLLIFFSQEWCSWCHNLLETMNDPYLSAFINENYIPVLIEGADDDFVKQILGKEEVTYPTLLILSPQGEEVVVITGAGTATVPQVTAALKKVLQIKHEKDVKSNPVQENKSACSR